MSASSAWKASSPEAIWKLPPFTVMDVLECTESSAESIVKEPSAMSILPEALIPFMLVLLSSEAVSAAVVSDTFRGILFSLSPADSVVILPGSVPMPFILPGLLPVPLSMLPGLLPVPSPMLPGSLPVPSMLPGSAPMPPGSAPQSSEDSFAPFSLPPPASIW